MKLPDYFIFTFIDKYLQHRLIVNLKKKVSFHSQDHKLVHRRVRYLIRGEKMNFKKKRCSIIRLGR